MYFILSNHFFDITISVLFIINVTITMIISLFELKNDIIAYKNNKNLTGLDHFKLITNIIFIILFVILIILTNKYKITSYIILLYCFSLFLIPLKLSKKDLINLTTENKIDHVQATILFIFFFSSKITSIYIKVFSILPHMAKEYLLIVYLVIKLIFFIYCTIINFSLLIFNLCIIFNKQLKYIKKLLIKFSNVHFEIKLYDFYLSKGNSSKKLLFVSDIIIYILTCPLLIIFYTKSP